MTQFDRLIGEWHGTGDYPSDPPMHLVSDAKIERLGELIVFSSKGQPAEVPDTLSIIGGAREGDAQPMAYFDSRGVRRRYLTSVEGSTWTIWRAPGEDWNGPDGPGFNQRFTGEISADGNTIEGRWERGLGPAGAQWELDFPMTYVRTNAAVSLFAGIPVDDFQSALTWYENLFGRPPAFFATETEAVWQLAEDRSVYVVRQPDRAGHAINTILVHDLAGRVAVIAERGLEPSLDETYDNGTRKVTYRDPDGNEFGFGGLPR